MCVAISPAPFLLIENRRKVGRKSYQWGRASIDELMLGTSRHNHEVPSFDVLVLTSDSGFAYSRGECQGLVDGVNLGKHHVSPLTRQSRGA